MRRAVASLLLLCALASPASARSLLSLGRADWNAFTQPQKFALCCGYIMAGAAIIVALVHNFDVDYENLKSYVVMDVGAWQLVEDIDSWYREHEGEFLLFALIAKLGTGRSHGEGQGFDQKG